MTDEERQTEIPSERQADIETDRQRKKYKGRMTEEKGVRQTKTVIQR